MMGTVVAGVVVQTVPGAAGRVAARLGAAGLQVEGDDGDRRIAAVWEGAAAEDLERSGRKLMATDEEILGVYPVYSAHHAGPAPADTG